MSEVVMKRKQALSFLSSFGKNVGDLKVTFALDGKMSSTVAFMSHYFHKVEQVEGEVKKSGTIDFTELEKICKFLKSAKGENVTIKQLGTGKTLYINAGTTKVQFPSSSAVVSYSKVPLIEKLIDASKDSQWTKWHTFTLDVSGQVNVTDLLTVSKMRGILNASPLFRVIVNAGESELCITAGKKHEARLFNTVTLTDPVGPNAPIESTYGAWLMESIGLLKEGPAEVHMGSNTVFVVEQGEDLLVVVDQRA
jgi:hypothetical protein